MRTINLYGSGKRGYGVSGYDNQQLLRPQHEGEVLALVSDQGQAIAAFERASTRAGIRPPERYPPEVSGDSITTNELAYPRSTCAAGLREGHGTVYVEVRNDVGMRHQ